MQNIKKYFMTLALLLTAVTGAWAQSAFNVVEFEVPADWKTDNTPLTAVDLPGFNAVTLDEAQTWTGAPAQGRAMLVYAFDGNTIYFVNYNNGNGGGATTSNTKQQVFALKSLYKFYYTTEITEWPLTSQDGKTWTLAKMPANDIELQVEYFAESNLFLSEEALANKANISVLNGETAVAFDDEGKSTTTVTEGNTVTAKFTGKKVLGMKVEKKAAAKTLAEATSEDIGKIAGKDGNIYATKADAEAVATGNAVAMIAYVGNGSDCTNGLAIQLNASPESKNWNDAKTYASGLTAVPGGTWRLPSKADWQNMFVGCAKSGDAGAGDTMDPIAGFREKIGATGITWQSNYYWSSTDSGSNAWGVNVYLNDSYAYALFYELVTSSPCNVLGCLAF